MADSEKVNKSNPNFDIKVIKLNIGKDNYKCIIQIIQNYLQISIYSGDALKYQGNIHLSKIQTQIKTFLEYTIDEIFEEISLLNDNNFNLIKDMDKFSFQIEFKILRRHRYLYIDLIKDNNISLNTNDYIKTISELKEIIKAKDARIKYLEKELENSRLLNNNILKDNYIIELKEPIYKIKYHKYYISCSTVLNDGRFAIGSNDNSIIIYNSKTFKPELTIKEHNNSISNIINLSSGGLASCSWDKTIKIYNINENKYKVMQTLKYHTDSVWKIIELRNKKLASCSEDKSIILYYYDNNEYKKEYSISTNGPNGPIIETNDNEICYSEVDNNSICFYDTLKKKIISQINNVSITSNIFDSLLMITKDLLLVTGNSVISIVNINSHSLIRTIDVPDSNYIYSACLLNNNTVLTSDYNKRIIQWKIEGDNLLLISKKENAHDGEIYTLSKLPNGLFISGSRDKFVKIW